MARRQWYVHPSLYRQEWLVVSFISSRAPIYHGCALRGLQEDWLLHRGYEGFKVRTSRVHLGKGLDVYEKAKQKMVRWDLNDAVDWVSFIEGEHGTCLKAEAMGGTGSGQGADGRVACVVQGSTWRVVSVRMGWCGPSTRCARCCAMRSPLGMAVQWRPWQSVPSEDICCRVSTHYHMRGAENTMPGVSLLALGEVAAFLLQRPCVCPLLGVYRRGAVQYRLRGQRRRRVLRHAVLLQGRPTTRADPHALHQATAGTLYLTYPAGAGRQVGLLFYRDLEDAYVCTASVLQGPRKSHAKSSGGTGEPASPTHCSRPSNSRQGNGTID